MYRNTMYHLSFFSSIPVPLCTASIQETARGIEEGEEEEEILETIVGQQTNLWRLTKVKSFFKVKYGVKQWKVRILP